MFTSGEARQCLANRKIFFSGDSYQIHFFIGLAGEWPTIMLCHCLTVLPSGAEVDTRMD